MIIQRKLGIRRYSSRVTMYTGWPTMIALVDIFFLLLWFFAQSSSYTRLSGIRVELPKVKASSIADIHQCVISIMPTGDPKNPFQLYFGDHPVELAKLPERLTKQQEELTGRQEGLTGRQSQGLTTTVAVLIDRRAPYELVAQVLAVVGNMGRNCFLPVMVPEDQPERRFEK